MLKLDAALWLDRLEDVPAAARAAEAIGLDTLWTSDTSHSPFLPLALAAEHTEHLRLGTAIVVAFARSPMDVAYQAWDLARYSRNRFVLGLGTQVSAHITRRFGMPWPDSPVDAMREYVAAVRAIWHTWQTGERLNFRGRFHKLTLMTPFFDPGPNPGGEIPIYTAGVNRGMCRLAGEIGDGFHVHPLHTRRYLTEVVRPAVQDGAQQAGRDAGAVEMSGGVFVAVGDDQPALDAGIEGVRRQVAFYGSTPAYAAVMDLHGWSEAHAVLGRLAARKQWDEMPALVSDEMVETFAVIGAWNDVPRLLQSKYAGLLDRVTPYLRFEPPVDIERWRALAAAFRPTE